MTNEATKTGRKLARWVADAYRKMGARKAECDVEMAGSHLDVYVELETPGCLLHCVAIEVKDWVEPVGIETINRFADVADLLRDEGLIDEGVIVSASSFSRQARDAARTHGIRLLEQADLGAMVARAKSALGTQSKLLSGDQPSAPQPVHPPAKTVSTGAAESTEDPTLASPSSPAPTQAPVVRVDQSDDVYSRYESGLRQLLARLGPGHPGHSDALVYEQRLTENITMARRHGDTPALKAERSTIVVQLNRLACSQLDMTFNDLCRPVPERPVEPPPETLTAPPDVLVPAGPFWMGSSRDDAEAYENEKPRRQVHLRDYRIGRYPITNAEYAFFVRDTGRDLPDHWEGGMLPTGLADHPVVNVNYQDAEAYCSWLSQVTGQRYHLPTEEEWEKAARGGYPETRRYPCGDEWRIDCCNTREQRQEGATSVHEFEQINRSLFEVVDMAGNVWEWTSSWYGRYRDSLHESSNYGQICRVVRGGSWRNTCREARLSCRGRYRPDVRRSYLGFRIVLRALD